MDAAPATACWRMFVVGAVLSSLAFDTLALAHETHDDKRQPAELVESATLPGFRLLRHTGNPEDVGLGDGWVHPYWVRLTGTHNALFVHLPDRSLEFRRVDAAIRPAPDRLWPSAHDLTEGSDTRAGDETVLATARTEADGTIARVGADYRWSTPQGQLVEFRGAYPIAMRHRIGEATRLLRYRDGRLVQVVVPAGHRNHDRRQKPSRRVVLELHYADGRLHEVTRSDGASISIARHAGVSVGRPEPGARSREPSATRNIEHRPRLRDWRALDCLPDPASPDQTLDRCDVERHPPPASFGTTRPSDDYRQVDLRPASCESYFEDANGIRRGRDIERALVESGLYDGLASTVPNFPVADFVGPDSVVAVVSHDLDAERFDEPDSLFETLMSHGADTEARLLEPVREHGSIHRTYGERYSEVDTRSIERPIVELVVRDASLTTTRHAEIDRARAALAIRYGIELRVVAIP